MTYPQGPRQPSGNGGNNSGNGSWPPTPFSRDGGNRGGNDHVHHRMGEPLLDRLMQQVGVGVERLDNGRLEVPRGHAVAVAHDGDGPVLRPLGFEKLNQGLGKLAWIRDLESVGNREEEEADDHALL